MSHTIDILFAGQRLLLDAEGALYWPDQRLLIVSDLHMEKASFLAQFGSPLPRYDTLHTLERLHALIARYRPDQLICLGDSFHDAKAFARLMPSDQQLLHTIIAQVPQWHWVLGNHDPALADTLPGLRHAALNLSGISLLHEPSLEQTPQIVGHFHPKITVRVSGHRISGKSFLHDDKLLIMPAFGSYTGGLNVRDEVIQSLVTTPDYYLTYRGRLWKIPA